MDSSQVDAALKCLHDPRSDNDKRRQADAWLHQYQQTPEAWQMADAYLALDPTQSNEMQARVFFGASTMAHKLANDFDQLPASLVPSLQGTLLRHISRMSDLISAGNAAEASTKPILRKLCVALADVFLQVPSTDPRSAIQALCATFQPPKGSLALLEIMRAMPEEATRRTIRVDPARRRAYVAALKSVGEQALQLLHQLLQASASAGHEATLKAVFPAFGAWVYWLMLPAETVAASPMLVAALEATLRYPSLFDPACEALQDVVETYTRPHHDAKLLTMLLPALLSLEPLYDAAAKVDTPTENADACQALAHLFSDAGTTYLDYLCQPQYAQGAPAAALDAQRVHFVQIISKIVAHPSLEVSSATFRFWRALMDTYRSLSTDHGRSYENEQHDRRAWREHVRLTLLPLMEPLTLAVVQRLAFPPIEDWSDPEEWPTDRKQDFKANFRYDCSDTLLLCAEIAGYQPVLQALAARLQSELAQWEGRLRTGAQVSDGWQNVEACLYAIRAIARYVPDREDAVLPAVFTLLQQLPPVEELRATSFRLIGRYAAWLRAHAQFLVPALTLLFDQGLGLASAANGEQIVLVPSPALACACAAVQKLSKGTGSESDGSTCQNAALIRDQILKLASRIPIASLNVMNAKQVLEGLCLAIGCLTPPAMPYMTPQHQPSVDHRTVMVAIVTPLLHRLQQFIDAPSAALERAASDGLLLSCLTDDEGEPSARMGADMSVDSALTLTLRKAAAAQGGSILPQYKAGALPRVERAAAACVLSLCSKLAHFLYFLRPDPSQTLDVLGISAYAALNAGSREAALHKFQQAEHEVEGAAQRGISGGIAAVQQAALSVLMKVLQIYGPGGALYGPPGSSARAVGDGALAGSIVWEIEGVWSCGIDKCGTAILDIMQGILHMLQPLLSPAQGVPSHAYLGLARTIMREVCNLPETAGPAVGTIRDSFTPTLLAASECVHREFQAAVASHSHSGQGGGRAAPWAAIETQIEMLLALLMTSFQQLREENARLLPAVQQCMHMATAVLQVYSPRLAETALMFMLEVLKLVDPLTRQGMKGHGQLADLVAQMLGTPGVLSQLVKALAFTLGSSSHEPVINCDDSKTRLAVDVSDVLYELARLAPEEFAGLLQTCLADGAIIPAAHMPTAQQVQAAFSQYMFVEGAQHAKDKVRGRGAFKRGVSLVSYAGVTGRLEDHDQQGRGDGAFRLGRADGDDNDADSDTAADQYESNWGNGGGYD